MLVERTSTLSLANALKSATRQQQVRLQDAQIELSTGRHADTSLVLGTFVGRNLDWRGEISRLETSIKRNAILTEKAKVTQLSIESIKSRADDLVKTLAGARAAQNGKQLSYTSGGHALASFVDIVSVTYSGEYLFSGQTPDVPPVGTYQGGPAQSAFDAAFVAEFGFSKSDPQAADITATQMQQFMQGRFSDLFEDPAWSSNWSNASVSNIASRIDKNVVVDASVNANELAFHKVLKGATAAFEAGGANLSQAAFQVVLDSSVRELAESVAAFGDVQARVGSAQEAVQRANDKMTLHKSLLETSVSRTEGVSEYDAANRVNALMTQLETSYAVTGRISRLSLLAYI